MANTAIRTWVFAQPEATGSNGWAGKALVAGLNLTNVDRMTAFYEDDARLIAAAPEMLDALKAIQHWASDARIPCCFPRCLLNAALEKAGA